MGPAAIPLRELSEMVTVNSGPGIRAPERAMTKDVRKMVRSPGFIINVYLMAQQSSTGREEVQLIDS